MKKSEVIDKLVAMEQKYCDLVWLARSRAEDGDLAAAKRDKVRELYPDEVSELRGDNSDWQHGFHSGCLAAFRLAVGLLCTKREREMAERDFPMLDT
jgi:hypothetical protein